jgi:hypothetical protein
LAGKEYTMTKKKISPYGSWISPVKANLLASSSIGLGTVRVSDQDVYWLESRPLEKGRVVAVRRTPDGVKVDVTPPDYYTRTTVHEYGGGLTSFMGKRFSSLISRTSWRSRTCRSYA